MTLPSSILFRHSTTGHLQFAEEKEWLITNGLGSFASGTIAGTLTRRYHGLLIAALRPPGGRRLLFSKAEETITYKNQHHELFTNNWVQEKAKPAGYKYIEQFHLEGTTPTWTYVIADARLEKRIWMAPGEDTTYIQYKMVDGESPLKLNVRVLVNDRDMHGDSSNKSLDFSVNKINNGLQVSQPDKNDKLFLLSKNAAVEKKAHRHIDFLLPREIERGFNGVDDHVHAGDFQWTLNLNETVTLIASTQPAPELSGQVAYSIRRNYERDLLKAAGNAYTETAYRDQLVLAADQFIVHRAIADDPKGKTIIAGYHWFSDWGRDTMISLPGLTLTTGRTDIARKIILTYAEYVNKGMLPNRFPEAGEDPEYNTVDAALWFFEAIRAYTAHTQDFGLVKKVFPILDEMIEYHTHGTRYNIHVDPEDGLLYAGAAGKQITWMDVKIDDWVVTPRIGKPIEINALWYNALCSMAEFASQIGELPENYQIQADRVKNSFFKFWNEQLGHCFDVLETPEGNDSSLRPNQLFAVALKHSPLPARQQKAIVDVCKGSLLTPFGIRSLGPGAPAYAGTYAGNPYQRDSVYHQGTVWAWLIGPFVQAHLRVYKDVARARMFLLPLQAQVRDHGLGSLSEIFDGNTPHRPRGAIAQAWSVAEWLRAWELLDHFEQGLPGT